MYKRLSLCVLVACVAGCHSSANSHPFASDDVTAREAVSGYVSRGTEALDELRELAQSDNPKIRTRAKTAIGRITGQWGEACGISWKTSLDDALGGDKPLLVLHLFGRFDEEFC